MSIYPKYRRSTHSKCVVEFIGPKEGYVVHAGTSNYKIGSLHTDWNHYNDNNCWEPYDYESTIQKINPENMDLFATIGLSGISSSTLTKVPNGYVMTSHSGHQIFIKGNTKETL